MEDFNRDVKTRDSMIFGSYHRSMYSGGLKSKTITERRNQNA